MPKNDMSARLSHYFEFGEFRLEPEKKRLWRKDDIVHLTPKSLDVLSLLVENHGRTVSRSELLENVWKGTFIEEGNINFNISLLRKALRVNGSSAREFIKTVPKEGYQFVEDVTEIIEENARGETIETEVIKGGSLNAAVLRLKESENLTRSRVRWHFIGIALLAVLLVSSFGLWWKLNGDRALNGSGDQRRITSIAVLPLKSLSNDPDDRPLSLGFADALITRLGQIGQTRVISTGAVSRIDLIEKEPAAIGRSFGVDSIIDGSFQKVNGKLRVTLRLFQTSDGAQIWSGSFDESESEVFHLQEAMAAETARALNATLGPQTVSRRLTDNVEAYKLFLKGDYLFRQRGVENSRRAAGFFRQAISLDQGFARAWAGLAAVSAMLADESVAESAAARALEIDPNLSEAHATLGFLRMFHDWDWAAAETELDRAVELDNNSVEAHHWRGVLYSFHGRVDEARSEMQRALEIDPLSLNLLSDLGQLYYFGREYDKAERYCLDALEIDPDYKMAHDYLRSIYYQQGRSDESFAKQTYIDCFTHLEDKPIYLKCVNISNDIYGRGGWKNYFEVDVRGATRSLRSGNLPVDQIASNYFRIGISQMSLGNNATAIENFNRALDAKQKFEIMNFTFPYMKVDPIYDPIRNDPGFLDLLRKLDLN